MPNAPAGQQLPCHSCGHGWSDHEGGCTAGRGTAWACACTGFRWVDPAPAPDLLGYHRRPS